MSVVPRVKNPALKCRLLEGRLCDSLTRCSLAQEWIPRWPPMDKLLAGRNLQLTYPLVWHVCSLASWPPRFKIQSLTHLLLSGFIFKISIVPYFLHKENVENSISSALSVTCGLVPVCKLFSVHKEASKESGSNSIRDVFIAVGFHSFFLSFFFFLRTKTLWIYLLSSQCVRGRGGPSFGPGSSVPCPAHHISAPPFISCPSPDGGISGSGQKQLLEKPQTRT